MFELIGDKKELYQWDRDRKITVPKGVTKIRFSNLTHGVSTDKIVSGNEVEIPPELLRIYGDLYVWGGDENNTDYSKHFNVIKSPKPADYIYTPEELKTWEDLQNQIGNLENLNTEAKDNLVNAINEVLLNGGGAGGNGVGIKKIEQTTKSTEDNGENIITVTLTNNQKYTFSVFNGSKGSKGEKGDKGDKGEQGAKGENGKSAFEYAVEGGYSGTEEQFGVDLSKVSNKITAPETAQIGQTIVVKSVNDAMQPTEWECANLPIGGGSEWKHIRTVVIPEDITTDTSGVAFNEVAENAYIFAFDTDSEGNPFNFKEMRCNYEASCNHSSHINGFICVDSLAEPRLTSGFLYVPAFIGKTGSKFKGYFGIEIMTSNRALTYGSYNGGTAVNNMYSYRTLDHDLTKNQYNAIDVFSLGYGNNVGFEVGSKFEFYGR